MYSVPKSKVKLSDFNSRKGLDRGAVKIKEVAWYILKWFFFMTAVPYPSLIKVKILRMFGAHIGRGVVIKPRVNILFPWKIFIGDHVWIGEEALILNFEKIIIGGNACISQRSFLCGGNHDFRDPSMSYRNAPIILEDGCWVGACCFIGPGVTIGTDTIVTAGSVVTKSIRANGIFAGSPAVEIGTRWKEPSPGDLKNGKQLVESIEIL